MSTDRRSRSGRRFSYRDFPADKHHLDVSVRHLAVASVLLGGGSVVSFPGIGTFDGGPGGGVSGSCGRQSSGVLVGGNGTGSVISDGMRASSESVRVTVSDCITSELRRRRRHGCIPLSAISEVNEELRLVERVPQNRLDRLHKESERLPLVLQNP
jgi:hypothetical protein